MLKEHKSKLLAAALFIEILFCLFLGDEKFGIIAAGAIFTLITWAWIYWKPEYKNTLWFAGTGLSILAFFIADPTYWLISSIYIINANSIVYLLEIPD